MANTQPDASSLGVEAPPFDDGADDTALPAPEEATGPEPQASFAALPAPFDDALDAVYDEEGVEDVAAPPFDPSTETGSEIEDPLYEAVAADDRPVPRINIHAFMERPETSRLMEEAAADRRLSRAHVTIQMGGIPAAAEHFQETPTPNLIIVETVGRGSDIFGSLDALADVCDASTRVIVVGAVNDIALYRELIRRGISEYVVAPRSPMQLIHSIAALYVDPSAPPIGRAIAFFGARGGVGSSTISHNVAWAFAEKHKVETTIIDFDLAFGTAALDFNQDSGQGICEALYSPERLDDVLLDRLLTKCSDYLNLFAAPSVLDRDYPTDAGAFETVVDVVRQATPFAVLDLPHQWSDWTKRLIMTADQVVLTATADLASLRNTKNMFDLIVAARPNDPAPLIVLNQLGAPKRPEIPLKDFAEALGAEPSFSLPWDPQLFGTAANNAMTIMEVNARNKASETLEEMAQLLSGRDQGSKKGSSLLGRLLGKS